MIKQDKKKLAGKYIFWKRKKDQTVHWATGYIHTVEDDMILIGTDNTISSELYHSSWYEIKDVNIKIRKGKP